MGTSTTLGVVEFTEFQAPNGSIYKFDTTERFLMTEEGLGLPQITYITQKGPFQHGESLIDYRLNTRTIQLVLRQDSCDRTEYWINRAALLDAVRPNRYVGYDFNPGILRKRFPDGSIREIKVIIEQGPVFAARSLDRWDEFGFTETLRFVAHDPIFYDPTVNTKSFSLSSGILDQLVFSITFPIEFDSSYYNSGPTPVTYTGTWFSFPVITITGPQFGTTIENLSTGEKIALDYALSAGEVVTINLDYGNKTVTNAGGTNLIGTVTSDSDLSTFHIAPDPEVAGGVNDLSVASMGNNEDSSVVVTYYTRYIGI